MIEEFVFNLKRFGYPYDEEDEEWEDEEWGEDEGEEIFNEYNNRFILGTEYDDFIENSGKHVTIDAGDGSDEISNDDGSNVSINGGAGNDNIESYGFDVTIDGGTGNDYIFAEGSNITINGGDGDDTISVEGDNVSVSGGKGADVFSYSYLSGYLDDNNNVILDYSSEDTIEFEYDTVTDIIKSGNDVVFKVSEGGLLVKDAADKIITYTDVNGKYFYNDTSTSLESNEAGTAATLGANYTPKTFTAESTLITIDASAALHALTIEGNSLANEIIGTHKNDSINGGAGNDSLNGGDGNDKLFGEDGNDSLNGGDGYDSLSGGDGFDTLVGGTGNDTFTGGTGADVFVYNSGNDVISDYSETDGDKISLASGTITSVTTNNNNFIFTIGRGKLTVQNVAGQMITLIDSNGTSHLYGSSEFVELTERNVVYTNIGNGASIEALSGDATIKNYAPDVLIDTGAGDDYIYNSGMNVLIDSGDGDDTIYNDSGESCPLESFSTLSGGNGNDSIYNFAKQVMIDGGDGDDVIKNAGDEVLINGGAGNDTIFNDNGESEGGEIFIDGGDGDDYIYSYASDDEGDMEGISLNGGAGNDSIKIISFFGGKILTGDAGADLFIYEAGFDEEYLDYEMEMWEEEFGDDEDWFYDECLEEEISDDVITDYTEEDTIHFYKTAVNGISRSGKDVVFKTGYNTLRVKDAANKVITYIDTNGTKKTYNAQSWTLNGTTATCGSLVIKGIKSLGGFTLSGNVVTVSKASLGTGKVTISDGYTLKLGSDVTKVKTTNAWSLNGTTATYKQTKTAGYTLADNAITYSKKSVTTLATVTGVKSTDGLTFDAENKIVTVGAESLGTDNITISDGYTLKLASDIMPPKMTAEGWILDGMTVIYISESVTEGYTLANNEISYAPQTDAAVLVAVEGVKNFDGLTFDAENKIVTVSKASLGTEKVTINDGYTLKLGSDVAKTSTTNAWSLDGTTANCKQTKTAGYTLADNEITYSKKSATTLATVTGVKSTDGLSLSGKVVTVGASALGTEKVTISDGYTLKLGSDVTAPKTTKAGWTFNGTTATYFSASTSAGYKLASNAISYTAKKDAEALVAVEGVKSLDGISLKKKVVTVGASALGTDKVTISDGYTLKLGSDVAKTSMTKAGWTLNGTTATYKSASTTAGYKLASNAITYSEATAATKLATIKGATSTNGLKLKSNTITAAASALSKKVTVSGSYTYDFAADYSKATITGSASNDTIVARGKNILVKSGKGNDTIKILGAGSVTGGAGSDVFYYKSSGANVITDYAEEDKISIASGTAATSTSGDDLILTVGKGKISVTGGADKLVTYIDAGGEHVYKKFSIVEYNSAGTGATLTTNYTEDNFTPTEYADYASTLKTIDASVVDYELKIVGNKRANKIIGTSEDDYIDGGKASDTISGGKGKDTLVGGKGDDSLYGGAGNDSLWGGAGDDTLFGGKGYDLFVYNDGDGSDVIEDFNSGDKIRVLSGIVENPAADAAGDVIFTVGDGEIIVKGGADKSIPIYDSGKKILAKYTPKG